MLRSLIAHVFFLFATVAISMSGLQSARAEIPFEAWLSVAAESFDQQIYQQIELPRQTFQLLSKRTAASFGRVMDQCRMGVGGTRGLQLVRAVDLLVELRDSGVAGAFTSKKNWNFPAENFELQAHRLPLSRSSQDFGRMTNEQPNRLTKSATKSVKKYRPWHFLLGPDGGHRLVHTALARLGRHTNEAVDRLEEAVFGSAEPLILAASREWDRLTASTAHKDRADLSDSHQETPEKSALWEASKTFGPSVLMSYYLEVSNSAQAKLNWLTSKVRHIVEACLKRIEPQFLILEPDSLG